MGGPQSGKALRYDGAALKDVDLRDLRGGLSVLTRPTPVTPPAPTIARSKAVSARFTRRFGLAIG